MRKVIFILLAFILLPSVLAINVNVEKISKNEVMIIGLDQPTIFKLNITNNGPADEFSFYTFFGLGLEPKEPITFNQGETKTITLQVFPRSDSKIKGLTSFSYFIQGKNKSEVQEKLTLKIIDLKEAFEIGSGKVNPESNTIEIYLKNKINYNFSKINIQFQSAFFDIESDLSLGPFEKKVFKINLDKSEFNQLMAGFYTLKAKVKTQGLETNLEGKIEFVEKNLVKTEEKSYGFIVSTDIIKKINQGNTLENVEIILKKSIISRIFTSFEPEPLVVERQGSTIYFTWNKDLNPGESFQVEVKTNWLIPFLIILLILGIIILVKKYP